MTLSNLFDLTFKGRAEEVGLEFCDSRGWNTLTFREVDARSRRMASVLAARGLRRGDRLCVFLPNGIEFIDLYLACVTLGAIFVPINILYKEREVGHIVRDAEPLAVVAMGDAPVCGAAVWQADELAADALRSPIFADRVVFDGDDPALIVYTSGTTGVSKGAVLTHNNLVSNAINLNVCWQITSSDRLLLTLPLFHVHGLGNGLHCWLISGCSMRLCERFDSTRAEALFLDYRPTLFFGVPTMYVRLLSLPGETARTIGSSMRLFVCGSAPLPAHVLEEFEAKFGHRILERYGMTETLMNISNPYTGERRPGSVGLPLPGVSVQVRDPEGHVLGDGETGELYVRGPNVFSQYWKRPDATQAAFLDGWFRTGDVGERSTDGYYTLKGRRCDLIISGGFNIYPREIEEFLMEQEGVVEAAVAGIPDKLKGEVAIAYVVCNEDLDLKALDSRCRSSFASFKAPRAYIRVGSLPRTALGKIQKHLLPAPALEAGQ